MIYLVCFSKNFQKATYQIVKKRKKRTFYPMDPNISVCFLFFNFQVHYIRTYFKEMAIQQKKAIKTSESNSDILYVYISSINIYIT